MSATGPSHGANCSPRGSAAAELANEAASVGAHSPDPLRSESNGFPASGRRAHGPVRVGLRATPWWNLHPAHRGHGCRRDRPRRPCRRSSMRWPGSAWSTTKVRSTRCSGWIGIERSCARWRSAASRTAATCSRPSSTTLRAAQMARGEKPRYDGRWRPENAVGKTPPAGVAPVIRFKNPLTGSVVWDDRDQGRIEIANAELDDLVLARPDGTPTYNFCVVVDDLDMRITHVVRGDDHVNNTPRQINIIRALGFRAARIRARADRARRRRPEALQAARRGGRHAIRGAGLPAGGDGQFSRPVGLGARRRRGVHARRVGRVVRARRDQRGSVAVQRRQAQVVEPGAHEAARRSRARAQARALPRTRRARSREGARARRRGRAAARARRRRSPKWRPRRATSTWRRSPPPELLARASVNDAIGAALADLAMEFGVGGLDSGVARCRDEGRRGAAWLEAGDR